MNLRGGVRVHRSEGGCEMDALESEKQTACRAGCWHPRRTTFMKTLMTTLLVAGSALMAAQTGTMPAPAANSSSPASATAPAKVKKHHHKSKKTDTPAAATNAAPASAAPVKK